MFRVGESIKKENRLVVARGSGVERVGSSLSLGEEIREPAKKILANYRIN